MPSNLPVAGPPQSFFTALQAPGAHAHCRGCKERINVSIPVAMPGWHTVHACAPEHAIEVNVRAPGAEPWAWRYAADAVAAADAPMPGPRRRR